MINRFNIETLKKNQDIISKVKTVFYFNNETTSQQFEKYLQTTDLNYNKEKYKIGASYNFINRPTENCEELIFADGNFLLSPELFPFLQNRKKVEDEYITFSLRVKI